MKVIDLKSYTGRTLKTKKNPKKKKNKILKNKNIQNNQRASDDILIGKSFAYELGNNVLGEFVKQIRELGVVGDEKNTKTIYLAITSRFLENPVSILIAGVTCGGKSFPLKMTIKFFSEEAYILRTSFSPHTLVFSEENFSHRTLIILELHDLGEKGNYFLRTFLSEGHIRHETIRGTKGIVYEREGPTNFIATTTHVKLHPENETRLITLGVDDSPEQTKRILQSIANPPSENIDLSKWIAFQKWLASEPKNVLIPYADKLSDRVPPYACRLRRDFPQVLALIKTHALLHQLHRERDEKGNIIANLDDYRRITELTSGVIAQGIGTVIKPTIRETVEAVKYLKQEGHRVTVKLVAEKINIDPSSASRRINEAIAAGFLINLQSKQNQQANLILGEEMPTNKVILPEPEELI